MPPKSSKARSTLLFKVSQLIDQHDQICSALCYNWESKLPKTAHKESDIFCDYLVSKDFYNKNKRWNFLVFIIYS